MGLIWSLVSPLLMLLVYTFVFSVVFKVRWGAGEQNNLDFALNLFVGVIVHAFLAECLIRSASIIAENENYVKKVIFPLWIIPVVALNAALFHLLVSSLVLVLCLLFYNGQLPVTILLFPILLLPYIIIALGLSWFLAALGVYLKDLIQVLPVISAVLLFLAPVFYPMEALPADYQSLLYYNPVTYVVIAARDLLLVGSVPEWMGYLKYISIAGVIALLGIGFFSRTKAGFADVL